jgi:hypothetical protein
MMRRPWYALALGAGVVLLGVVDQRITSDDGGQLSLLLLLAVSAVLGWYAPRLAWLSGVAMGSVVAVTSMLALTVGGLHPADPPTMGGAVSMLVLIVPATVAAYAGAMGRRAVSSPGQR